MGGWSDKCINDPPALLLFDFSDSMKDRALS